MYLSVVIVNWNSANDLERCLASLENQTYRKLEVVVVDNGSTDGSGDMVRSKFPRARLLAENENLGFAEGVNRGIRVSRGEWVALLNNDAVAEPEWAEALALAAQQCSADCGMLQSLMLFQSPENTVNSTGIELTKSGGGRDRGAGSRRPTQGSIEEIFCPTGGAAAYRRAMLEALALPSGYFDQDHFMYSEDLDLGWRARLAGWSAFYVPGSIVHHRWHGSTDRHGRAWLVVISRTNRIRTLLKNASWSFLVRTSLKSAYEVCEIVWHGGPATSKTLLRATVKSLRARRRVSALTRVPRRALERTWVIR